MVVLLVVGVAATASAQEPPRGDARTNRLVISDAAISRGLADAERAGVIQTKDDSVKNGIIIGAVIGAGVAVLAGNYLCEVFDEGTDAPCWGSILQIGALGAGIGAAAGWGIDAALARHTPLAASPQGRGQRGSRGLIRLRF